MIRSSPRESQAQNAPRGKSRRSRCNEAAGGAFPATLGGRIAVLANQASRDAALRPIWAALPARPVRLFAPEHGVLGALQAGEADHDGTDPITGAPVVALYGARSAPEPGHLADLDAVVVDLVDTGVRSYTYAATLYAVQRAAAAAGVPVVVLDRPNPLGRRREGGGVAPGHGSFVAKLDVPLRHGLTLGELARLNAATQGLPAPQVVPHWERSLPAVWVAPSPNIPTPAAALAYAGTVLIEGTALSEGRGTTRPFTTIGAPGLEAEALAAALAGEPGALVQSLWFTPVASKFAGRLCGGIELHIADPARFRPVAFALRLLRAVADRQPELLGPNPFLDKLAGGPRLRQWLDAPGEPPEALLAEWAAERRRFARRAAPHLMARGA